MPSTNPRTNVTLSPSLDSLVTRLAALQRVSKSHVLRELLETAAPALSRALAVMEAAERAKPEVLASLAQSMERHQAIVELTMEDALSRIDQADLVMQAEALPGRRPPRPARAASPHSRAVAVSAGGNPLPSNRGVKSPKKPGVVGKATAKRGTRKGVGS